MAMGQVKFGSSCGVGACCWQPGAIPVEQLPASITGYMESTGCKYKWTWMTKSGSKGVGVVCERHHNLFLGDILPEVFSQLATDKLIEWMTPNLEVDYELLYGERYGWT